MGDNDKNITGQLAASEKLANFLPDSASAAAAAAAASGAAASKAKSQVGLSAKRTGEEQAQDEDSRKFIISQQMS